MLLIVTLQIFSRIMQELVVFFENVISDRGIDGLRVVLTAT